MKKKIVSFMLVFLVSFSILSVSQANASVADGTYTVKYTVTKPEDSSVSIANDYFEKPATLIVKNGIQSVQLTLNHSDWITSLKVENKDVTVVSANKAENTRVVQFPVSDISKPTQAKVHVIIKDYSYDTDHSIALSFDHESMAPTDAKDVATEVTPIVSNPETGDTTNIMGLFALCVVSSVLLFKRMKSKGAL